MHSLKIWLAAARLRTLPLSISGIVVGTAIAKSQGYFSVEIFMLALLTTILFQVLSNFANDYGDGIKGTDNHDRVGPQRAIQSGALSPKKLLSAIIIIAISSLISAVVLIYKSFTGDFFNSFFFLILGVLAVLAAIKYTVGKKAYGYSGLGDVFVFVFFGLVSVLGSYFLYTKTFYVQLLLPATSIGLLSVAVLNLNNMRDMQSDLKAEKLTLAVKLGDKNVRVYHNLLLLLAMLCLIGYLVLNYKSNPNAIFLIAFIPLILHLITFNKTKDLKALDPELKKVALSTFLLALLFYFSFNNFL